MSAVRVLPSAPAHHARRDRVGMPARPAWRVRSMLRSILMAAAVAGPLVGLPVRAADLCDLVPNTAAGQPGRDGERVKDAAVAQARNILFEVLKRHGGVWGGRVSDPGNAGADAGLDPLIAYLNCQQCDKGRANAAIEEFIKGSLKVAFPAVDAVTTGGEVVVAGVAYGVDDLYRQTNPGYDVRIANAIPFWSAEPMASRGIDDRNVGEKVATEAELRDLWYRFYGNKIADFLPGGKREATTLLDQRWPDLLKTWKRSRASFVIRQFRGDLLASLTAAKASSPAGADVNDIFGLWRSPGGSIVALVEEGGSIVARYCRVGKKAAAFGSKKGDRLYWGGTVISGTSGGSVVIEAHSFAYPQPGDCPSLAPRDMGPNGVRLEASPGTIRASERRIKYYSDKCIWVVSEDTPEVTTWSRVEQ